MQVVYDYAQWLTLYPQFATTVTTEAQGQEYFYQAQLYCSNDDGSSTGAPPCGTLGYPLVPLIPYDPTGTPPRYDRAIILNLLTAHIAQLTVGCVINGVLVPPGPLVGRVSSATEGSVSVQTDMGAVPTGAAWFYQTQFGLMAWQAMAPYRTARYRASPGRFFQPPSRAYPAGYWPYGSA